MAENNMSDFDPYDWIIETSEYVEKLSQQHNQLAHDYLKTKQRIKMLEKQMIDLQLQLIAKDGI